MLSLPLDIINNILSFLDVNEVAALRATCRHLNISVNSPTICFPYLNRLKKLDAQISVLQPENSQEDWCYRRFVEGFNQIAERQQTEIKYFRTSAFIRRYGSKNNTIELLERLEGLNAPATTLKALEEIHEILENLNAAIIEDRMDPNLPMLFLPSCITRFPSSVFKPENKGYWSTLTELSCALNPHLRSLPAQLEICQALQIIQCGSCQIQFLPTQLGNCQALRKVRCTLNQIKFLSDELEKCMNLEQLECDYNYIITIPLGLRDKLGEEWFHNTLLKQIPTLITAHHTIKESNSTIPQLITSSIPEPSQHTGGEKRTLENDNDNGEYEDENPNKNKKNKRPKR